MQLMAREKLNQKFMASMAFHSHSNLALTCTIFIRGVRNGRHTGASFSESGRYRQIIAIANGLRVRSTDDRVGFLVIVTVVVKGWWRDGRGVVRNAILILLSNNFKQGVTRFSPLRRGYRVSEFPFL